MKIRGQATSFALSVAACLLWPVSATSEPSPSPTPAPPDLGQSADGVAFIALLGTSPTHPRQVMSRGGILPGNPNPGEDDALWAWNPWDQERRPWSLLAFDAQNALTSSTGRGYIYRVSTSPNMFETTDRPVLGIDYLMALGGVYWSQVVAYAPVSGNNEGLPPADAWERNPYYDRSWEEYRHAPFSWLSSNEPPGEEAGGSYREGALMWMNFITDPSDLDNPDPADPLYHLFPTPEQRGRLATLFDWQGGFPMIRRWQREWQRSPGSRPGAQRLTGPSGRDFGHGDAAPQLELGGRQRRGTAGADAGRRDGGAVRRSAAGGPAAAADPLERVQACPASTARRRRRRRSVRRPRHHRRRAREHMRRRCPGGAPPPPRLAKKRDADGRYVRCLPLAYPPPPPRLSVKSRPLADDPPLKDIDAPHCPAGGGGGGKVPLSVLARLMPLASPQPAKSPEKARAVFLRWASRPRLFVCTDDAHDPSQASSCQLVMVHHAEQCGTCRRFGPVPPRHRLTPASQSFPIRSSRGVCGPTSRPASVPFTSELPCSRSLPRPPSPVPRRPGIAIGAPR